MISGVGNEPSLALQLCLNLYLAVVQINSRAKNAQKCPNLHNFAQRSL